MSTLTHRIPRQRHDTGRTAEFRPAPFVAALVVIAPAWAAAIVWALTLIPGIVWAGLAVAGLAGLAGLRLWCDIVHGTAR